MATFYSEAWHSAPNGGAKYRLALVCNVASQNVEANTTTINWALVMQKDRSFPGFHEYTSQTTVRLDGTIVYDWVAPNPAVAWTGWSEATLASGTRTFTHGADGKKTIIVGGAWQRAASGWSPGSMDVSGTMVLPDIARATTPTVEPSPASVGAAVTIKMPRAINTYTHDVTWESGALSGTIGLGLGESATWTVPDVMGEFPGQTRAPITITVVTKTSGGVALGSRSVTLQATAPPPAPSLTTRKPGDEFDIRARQVVWDEATSEWRRGRILPTIELSMVDPYSASATCSLTMSKLSAVDFDDHSIIDIDVFDGENWRFTNHRFALSRVEGDDVDPSETYSYSGTEFVDYSLGFAYVPTDYKWTGASGEFGLTSAGNLVHYCIVKAKERGWGPRIDIAFTGHKTSFGDPWLNTNLNRTISKGTPISQALDGMVTDGYVEYRTEYHSNKAWLVLLNPGTGASFADVGASPVVNLALAKLTSAPRRGTSEKRLTRVTVVGDVASGGKDPISATRERAPFDPNVFGHMEGWVSASGVKSAAEVGRVGDNALRDNAGVVNERTFEYNAQDAAPQFYPYVVFRPGDWVLVPGKDAPEKDRISQITISKTQDSKTFTILTGDRILSGVASLAKRQSAQTGGAISGGTGMSPAPLDERIPAAPTIIDTTSTGYWTTDGNARSEITVSWAPVDTALSGSQVSVNLYEVWWREDVGGVWKFRAATADTEIDMLDWEVLKDYRLRVRARSAAGVYGEFSEDIEHTTLEPAVDLDGPVLNDLYTDGLGNIYAVWDGTLDGVPAPNRLGYIAAEVSSDGGVVYAQMGTPITAMGTIVIAPGDYGTFHVRLRAFDGLGNPGEVSDPLVITTENPHINEIVSLSSTTQALVAPAGGAGATTPATAVITGTEANTTITTWQYSVEGAAFSATVPAGVSRTGNTVTITGSAMTAKTIAVRASDAHGASDTLTIAKLANGAAGADGRGLVKVEPLFKAMENYAPSLYGATAPVGVRRNYVPNSDSVTASPAGWNGITGGTFTFGSDAGEGVVNVTTPGAAVNEGVYSTPITNALPAAGDLFNGSVMVKAPAGATLYLVVSTTGTGGTFPSTVFTGTGAWQKVTLPVAAASASNRNPYLVIRTITTAQAITFQIKQPLIEKVTASTGQGSQVGEFFSHTRSPDADMTAGSTGGVNVSPAILTGLHPTGFTDVDCVSIIHEVGDGTRELRLIPTGTSTSTYVRVSVPVEARASGTILGTLRQLAPLTGPTSGSRGYLYANAPQQRAGVNPNEGGSFPKRVAFSNLTADFRMYLWHGGSAGSGDVYWSKIGLYAGTPFDYDTWQTSEPMFDKNLELWRVEKLTYTDGIEYTEPTRVTSWDGVADAQDNTVTNQTIQYAVNASTTTAPTSGWASTQPSRTAGQVIWMRVVITYGDGGTSTSAPAVVTGDQGNAGAAAYTVILSNESHTFPGTASAAVAGSTTSRVFAYKGAAAQNATVGSITGAPTGMSTSIASNGTSAPIITITVTAALVTQSGTLSIPVTVDGITFTKNLSWAVAWSLVGAKLPLPPTALAAAPGAAWSASGYFPEAWFDLTWTAPTLDTNGDPITIAGYDVWGKQTNEPETRFLGSVTGTAMRVPVGDGEEWAFQVEATSTTGGKSGLTGVVTSTANGTPPVAPAPGSPTLDQSVGLLRIRWSGAGMLPQIKTVYATISTSLGGTYTRAGMPLTGPGEVIVPGLAPAQYWAKIVMVDERGTLSTSAAAGPITLLPITGVTIQTSPVADTGIKLTDAALTAYDVSGNPTFILDATTGAVWIAPYDAVFSFGASGVVAETGASTTGVQISSEGSSFNTFIHAAGIQIRNDHTPLSWWEADASDANLVNLVAPRARVGHRFKLGAYEFLREEKTGGNSRLVIRYQGD